MKLPLTLALTLTLMAGAAKAAPLTLSDAWRQLQSASDLLKAEQLATDRARAERDVTQDLGLPQLSLSGTYAYLDDPIALDLNPALPGLPFPLPTLPLTERDIYRASLVGSWPIYAGGRIQAAQAVKQAELDVRTQEQEIKRRERFTLLIDRYFGLQLAAQNADLRQSQVAALEKHLSNAEKLEQQGQIASVERMNAAVAVDQARVALAQAVRQRDLAQQALDSLLHLQQVEPVTQDSLPQQTPMLGELQRNMMATHPALALFDAKSRQARGSIESERGRYKPEVGLFGSYTLAEDNSILSELEPEWLVGIRVKVPLFSNDGRSDRVKAAKSAELEARHRKAQTEQDLKLLLSSQFANLEQARYELHALDSAEQLARENRRLRELAFRQGLGTSLEQVDADQRLLEVQLGKARARYQYMVALAQISTLGGSMEQMIEWVGP
ncbi:TolC family protein [Ferrimonas balearica]|uniref:TolC family protein n=1 Tax=Ferrimonas balearica TaxID=44012 RepID=UPI001C9A2141|nr:TolC family protein [Ferrimonas balearica]MBY5922488.1 TolC family protein [Ferrimonas balearica]MBY5995472.1 TolC family protein [Ferrimonas balearica]